MNYLIYGLDSYLIKNNIDKIKAKFSPISISKYNLLDTSISSVLDDAQTMSLFDDAKLIICDDSYIFTSSTKKEIDHNISLLEEYLKNPNEDCTIIFTVNYEKLDERKKIVKLIKEHGKIIECNKIDDIAKCVKNMFDDYKIDNKTINLLIDRVGSNLEILNSEIEKIKIYLDDNKTVNDEDIINLTNKNVDDNIFSLIENIVSDNKSEALESLNEMLKQNEEPIKIIIMLANQFRIIYQTKELYKQGYTEANIASILKIHPYRIKLALSKGRNFKSEELLKYLEELHELDYKIKTGEILKDSALELFILEN